MPATKPKAERIAIVGGGINGIMTAWALCDRGYFVDVYDRGDLMNETSAASSRMLHGGLRYLAKLRFHMVREALLERKWWRDQNTGMVREFLAHIPVRKGNLQELFIFGDPQVLRDGLSATWTALLSDWHRRCWYQVRHSRLICRLRTGTRPGDPLADLVFALAFAKAEEDLLRDLRLAGLMWELPGHDGTIFKPGAGDSTIERCETTKTQ